MKDLGELRELLGYFPRREWIQRIKNPELRLTTMEKLEEILFLWLFSIPIICILAGFGLKKSLEKEIALIPKRKYPVRIPWAEEKEKTIDI